MKEGSTYRFLHGSGVNRRRWSTGILVQLRVDGGAVATFSDVRYEERPHDEPSILIIPLSEIEAYDEL